MNKRKFDQVINNDAESLKDTVEKCYDLYLPRCFNENIWDSITQQG